LRTSGLTYLYEESINEVKQLNKTVGYKISQRMRKRIEGLFGEAKDFSLF